MIPSGMLAWISPLKAEEDFKYCRVPDAAKLLTPFWKARGQNYTKAERT